MNQGVVNGNVPVFSVAGDTVFTGNREDFLDVGSPAALSIPNGTIALTFNADDVFGRNTLFSKDGNGFDNGGHLTVWIENGRLIVRQQSADQSEQIAVPNVLINSGETHQLAVSFGDDGLKIYLDGILVAAEPEFEQGLETNDRALLFGASGSSRTDDTQTPKDPFDGTISDIYVYDSQLESDDFVALATEADPALGAAAQAVIDAGELAPAFAQTGEIAQTTQTYLDLARDYGFNEDGSLANGVTIENGTDAGDVLAGDAMADAINGGFGDDQVNGGGGNDTLQGDYGNDTLTGGAGRDVLDGGHGEDTLNGGDGDDLLISRSDGGEGYVAFDPDRDEGDPLGELDPVTGKLYPDQPIPSDDVLTGGAGSDVFYFQTLINAKQRFIEEHTDDDGTISWNRVAGENDNIHDHWVDVIGNDVITDFSRAEGDRIVIEGHTTQIREISYGDSNGDGVVDFSVIQLISRQGNNGGAHNNDLLGTITVYGDLVTDSDIEHSAGPTYGIVRDIDGLAEALAPLAVSEDTGPIDPPSDVPLFEDFGLVNGKLPVFGIAGERVFDGDPDSALDAGHNVSLAVANGTIALTFNADDVFGRQTLFSKDGRDFDNGGHLTVWIENGQLKIRQQSDSASEHLTVPNVLINAGVDHHLAVSFGDDGLKIFLDGALVAAEPEFKQGLEENIRSLLIGGSGTHRSDDGQDPRDVFEGTISDVAVYAEQLEVLDVTALAGDVNPVFEEEALYDLATEELLPAFAQLHHGSDTARALAAQYEINHRGELIDARPIEAGTDGADILVGSAIGDAINGGFGDDQIDGAVGNDVLQGFYGNDTLEGGAGNDVLDGGHGEDILNGGDGDDLLIAQADAREPDVAFDPNRDEGDPYNELDPATGKLYPDQQIPADDVLTGGAGADTFYFQTLINAKRRFIEEHTNDDGSIRWQGVAGENDNIHDHWVDAIGNDVITDFSRAEGDRIVIEGHTTQILGITYGDANNDGIIDHSVIQLFSDQGNGGGAHNDDLLGTITIYGDIVTEDDIEHDAGPAYGIVRGIDRLDEALQPLAVSADTGPIAPPDDLPTADEFGVINGTAPVFGVAGEALISGNHGEGLELGHDPSLAIANGTFVVSFNADDVTGRKTLFSKDGSGFDNGGHLTAYIEDGVLMVRQQSDSRSELLVVPNVTIAEGQTYHLAVSFGTGGLRVYLDGELVDVEFGFQQGLEANTRSLLLGASGRHRREDDDTPRDAFDGALANFAVYDRALTDGEIATLAGAVAPVSGGMDGADSIIGTIGDDVINGFGGDDTIEGGRGADLIDGGDGNDLIDGGVREDTLLGGNGADTIDGGSGIDSVLGGAGNDILSGGTNHDTIRGEAGDDDILGEGGHDLLEGGIGNDTLDGAGGDDTLNGGDGDDEAYAESGRDLVDGGLGNDLLNGGQNHDTITGGAGNDTLQGESGFDELYGGAGDDFLEGGVGDDILITGDGDDETDGGKGRDLIDGGLGNDLLAGGTNHDTITGGEGNDTILAEAGFDVVDAGNGDDEIDAGRGNDLVDAGAGDDTVYGGTGADDITGGLGDDFITGGTNHDTISGGEGNDTIAAGGGIDVVDGGAGDDEIEGGVGTDDIFGGTGNDSLDGGSGTDILDGGAGDDWLAGGTNHDTLIGGLGDDTLEGNSGNDIFVFADEFGTDFIEDFNDGAGSDQIDLSAVTGITDFDDLINNHLTTDANGNTIISDGINSITLNGVEVMSLMADDFIF
ncbi:MAG: LamG-like jellyroll fold domain-containing protein [Pseudomonadota bacterium]